MEGWWGCGVCGVLWVKEGTFLLHLLGQIYQLLHESSVRQVLLDDRLQLVFQDGLARVLGSLEEGAAEALIEKVCSFHWKF